jgi:hypothetical protein
MPRGPKGEKRPADVIGNAVHVMRIATGEIEEEYETRPEKNPAAVELGRRGGARGGRARAEKLTPEERQAIAKRAARSRWGSGSGS